MICPYCSEDIDDINVSTLRSYSKSGKVKDIYGFIPPIFENVIVLSCPKCDRFLGVTRNR